MRPQLEGKHLGITIEEATEYIGITTSEVGLLVKEGRISDYKSTGRVGTRSVQWAALYNSAAKERSQEAKLS
jgi:hypothetical protein